jgi:Flp pilus assembly protein TadD
MGGLYDWRSAHAKTSFERDRMAKEADLAYRQAFALCPYSPEAVYRYVTLLMRTGRLEDAILVASTAAKVAPDDTGLANLAQQLKQMLGK